MKYGQRVADSDDQRHSLMAGWLLLCLALAYVPDMGHGFIADDFAWIRHSDLHSFRDLWRTFVDTPMGFYRPVVSLSFFASRLLFGLEPFGYALTNLALVCAIAIAIASLARTQGFDRVAGIFAAALWTFNIHGVGMALTWISGRTSLLATLFAVLAAIAVTRGRGILGGGFTLAALLSKEEPLMLPAIVAAWVALDRWWHGAAVRPAAALRTTWPCFAALAVYLTLRQQSPAFTPWNAPDIYALSASPRVLVPNILEYADRSMTFAAAVLLIGLLAFARRLPALEPRERLVIAKGAIWLLLGFAVTVAVPLRSDLYVCFPAIGAALMSLGLGSAIWRTIPASRRRPAALLALLLPLALVPVYHGRNALPKDDAIMSTRVVSAVTAALEGRADITRVDVVQDRSERPAVTSALGGGLNDAIQLRTGRDVAVEMHLTSAADTGPPPQPGSLRVTVAGEHISSVADPP